jgi:hypothetical protein
MADQLENKTVDKRVVHRYLRKGIIEDRDWEKHVKGLPDLADQAAPVEASIEGGELEGEGGGDEGAA